jgi:hypothetical protein
MTEFTLRVPRYNEVDHLHGTMVEFGRYEVRYLPPEGSDEVTHSMLITSEADRSQMDLFFDKFLRAEGYPPSKTQFVVCEKHWDEFWELSNEDEARDNN